MSPPGSLYSHCTQTAWQRQLLAQPGTDGPQHQGPCPLCLPVSPVPACLPAPRGGGYSQVSHTPSCGPPLNPPIPMKTWTRGLRWTECFPAEPVDGALFGKRAFADIIKSRLSRGAHPGLGPQTQGSLQDQRSGETQEPCDNGDRAWSDAANAREAWTPRGSRVGWIPLEPLAGPRPANTLISDFGPPDHERKLFCGCKPPSCGFVPAAARFRLLTG